MQDVFVLKAFLCSFNSMQGDLRRHPTFLISPDRRSQFMFQGLADSCSQEYLFSIILSRFSEMTNFAGTALPSSNKAPAARFSGSSSASTQDSCPQASVAETFMKSPDSLLPRQPQTSKIYTDLSGLSSLLVLSLFISPHSFPNIDDEHSKSSKYHLSEISSFFEY